MKIKHGNMCYMSTLKVDFVCTESSSISAFVHRPALHSHNHMKSHLEAAQHNGQISRTVSPPEQLVVKNLASGQFSSATRSRSQPVLSCRFKDPTHCASAVFVPAGSQLLTMSTESTNKTVINCDVRLCSWMAPG